MLSLGLGGAGGGVENIGSVWGGGWGWGVEGGYEGGWAGEELGLWLQVIGKCGSSAWVKDTRTSGLMYFSSLWSCFVSWKRAASIRSQTIKSEAIGRKNGEKRWTRLWMRREDGNRDTRHLKICRQWYKWVTVLHIEWGIMCSSSL